MSKRLSMIMERVKNENTREAKAEFISELTKESFLVPMIAKTHKDENGRETLSEISHFSIASEGHNYLMVFTTVDEISKWRSDVQFVELEFKAILDLVESENASYTGIVIDHSGTNMAIGRNVLEKLKK